jgi:hypothetical protein
MHAVLIVGRGLGADNLHLRPIRMPAKGNSKAGQCWICGDALTAFDQAEPCPHWLLKPDGFEKEHFELLTQKYSLIRLEHYLRWVANEEAFAKNINDLADEGSGKLVELTIKYKNLQWSFSCGASDLTGHEGGGAHSKRPHWHFQMYADDKPFIRYNDFHAPLSERERCESVSRAALAWATCFTNLRLNRSSPWAGRA